MRKQELGGGVAMGVGRSTGERRYRRVGAGSVLRCRSSSRLYGDIGPALGHADRRAG